MKLIRQYLAGSPHRSVAVLPFDLAAGQKNLSAPAADMMESKMLKLGFLVSDHAKTRSLYNHSKIKNQTFDAPGDASDLVAPLGVQAVLVSTIDVSYERVGKQPAQYDIVTNPPPACCTRATNPCGSHLVYDPVVQANVDSCGPTHSKILINPAMTARLAAFSVRMRLIDTNTRTVFWESAEEIPPADQTVMSAADQATDTLSERMIEDYLQQRL
jgi:hypothetical protein